MSVNKVILVGRLGKDPSSNGSLVCNFSLATDESFKNRSGERQKKTEWHRVVAFGKLAEIAQQYLKKGMLVYIEGRIQTREWEKDGEKRTSFEIVANVLRMLEGEHDAEPAAASTGAGRSAAQQSRASPGGRSTERAVATDDDLPEWMR